eukprot:UN32367
MGENMRKNMALDNYNCIPVPIGISRIEMSLIDRLELSQIIFLKIAACQCVGDGKGACEFSLNFIRAVHPVEKYIDQIDDDISVLEARGFIVPFDKERETHFLFENYQYLLEAPYPCGKMQLSRECHVKRNSSDQKIFEQIGCTGLEVEPMRKEPSSPNGSSSIIGFSGIQFETYFFRMDGEYFNYYENYNDSEPQGGIKIDALTELNVMNDECDILRIRTDIDCLYIKGDSEQIDLWDRQLRDCKVTSAGIGMHFSRSEITLDASSSDRSSNLQDRYAFRSGVLRDTVYQIMLYKQRRGIHRKYADGMSEWVKAKPEDNFLRHSYERHEYYAKNLVEQKEKEVASPDASKIRTTRQIHRITHSKSKFEMSRSLSPRSPARSNLRSPRAEYGRQKNVIKEVLSPDELAI